MKSTMRTVLAWSILAMCVGCASHERPTIGAASSLRFVMPDLLSSFEQETGRVAPRVTYGASGTLARQLRAGAPIEGVVLASGSYVDGLIGEGLLDAGTRLAVANNALVLAVRRPSRGTTGPHAASLQGATRLAIGDPRFVPSGSYTQSTLLAQGRWGSISNRIVFARDVAGAVALLRRGEVDGAFVYETDVLAHDDLMILERLPRQPNEAPQVVGARQANAATLTDFFVFFQGPTAATILREHGFEPPTS